MSEGAPSPRLMTKADAAAYCGVCPATFTNWVASGVMPSPFRGTRMYDRHAIDAAIDRDSGILRATAPEEAPWTDGSANSGRLRRPRCPAKARSSDGFVRTRTGP